MLNVAYPFFIFKFFVRIGIGFYFLVAIGSACFAEEPVFKQLVCSDGKTQTQAVNKLRHASPSKKKEIAVSLIQFFSQWDSQAITVVGCDYHSASKAAVLDFKYIGTVAIPLLLREIKKNTSNSLWATDCLAGIGSKAIPAISRVLQDPEAEIRNDMVNSIRTTDFPETDKLKLVLVLMPLLNDPSGNVRANTCEALGNLGPASAPAVSKLIEKLKDKNVSNFAIRALGKIGTDAKEAVPALIPFLHNKDVYLRSDAALALNGIGEGAKQAIPDLLKAIHDEDSNVRYGAFNTLREIGPDAKAAIPDLIQFVKGSDYDNAFNAVFALVAIDPKQAEPAIPILTKILQDPNPHYSSWAVEGLRKIGTSEALEAIRKYGKNKSVKGKGN